MNSLIRRESGNLEPRFLPIYKDKVEGDDFYPEDCWFEIKTKTLYIARKRYGADLDMDEFMLNFKGKDIGKGRMVRYSFMDHEILDLYHTEEAFFAKLYTGRGNMQGVIKKDFNQGSTMIEWKEFRGREDTRGIPPHQHGPQINGQPRERNLLEGRKKSIDSGN